MAAIIFVMMLSTAGAAQAAGLPFPDDPIDTDSLGGFSALFGNVFTTLATIGVMLSGAWIVWSILRYNATSDLGSKQKWVINALGALASFIILGSIGDVFDIVGSVGAEWFNNS
ncbi:MAG TPA: hypothetical protein VNI82_00380 [Candidatus Nitrosotenuis sp.]|nr:hypothetical protein [Candidatus Nitrosotenuis sp.]